MNVLGISKSFYKFSLLSLFIKLKKSYKLIFLYTYYDYGNMIRILDIGSSFGLVTLTCGERGQILRKIKSFNFFNLFKPQPLETTHM